MAKTIVCHDIKGRKYAVSPDKLVFRPSVYGVIIRGNKILLSREWDGYDFPGGGIEQGETIAAALKREVWEENGLNVVPNKLVGLNEAFFAPRHRSKREYWHAIILHYLCKKVRGRISNTNFDSHEKHYKGKAEWVPLSKVGKIKLYNSVDSLKIIREANRIITSP